MEKNTLKVTAEEYAIVLEREFSHYLRILKKNKITSTEFILSVGTLLDDIRSSLIGGYADMTDEEWSK